MCLADTLNGFLLHNLSEDPPEMLKDVSRAKLKTHRDEIDV